MEIPIRLINDCFYLAGEMGLMALGIGHLGFNEIAAILEEISQTMDLCAVSWRDRYLVCSQRINVNGVGKCTGGINSTSSSCRRIYIPLQC